MTTTTRAFWTVAFAWLLMLLGGASWSDTAIVAVSIEPTRGEVAAPAAIIAPAPRRPTSDYPFVAGEDTGGSVSVGDTSHGRLVNGARLEETKALGILPKQRDRALRYGSDQLVAMLHAAANELHRNSGRRMWVGHLSRRGGGDIPYSVSHNSGRDADIAFCYRNASREPVDPPGLLAVSSAGATNDARLHFDAACTWQIVKALLQFDGAEPQYMFMAGSLEGMVTRHAMDLGEPAELIERAAQLIRQPGGRAAPHSDHLHLRVHCSERDIRGGCQNQGAPDPRHERLAKMRAEWVEQLVHMLETPDPETRRRAIERLAIVGDGGASIRARLKDPSHDVRLAAAGALARLGDQQAEHVLSASQPLALRLAAIDATVKAARFASVPLLTTMLDDEDETVRRRSLRALQSMTGRPYVDRGGWRAVWKIMKTASPHSWLVSAFRGAGYRILQLDHPYTWEIVRALMGRAALSRHASETLVMLFAHHPPIAWKDDLATRRALCRHWLGWLDHRRALYELSSAPLETTTACR